MRTHVTALLIVAVSVLSASGNADEVDSQKSPAPAAADKPSLAEQIALIRNEHKKEHDQFYNELRALAKKAKQLGDAKYREQVSAANTKYNEFQRPAAEKLIELIKTNRNDPAVVEGLILLEGDMSHSLGVDPLLLEIVLVDQITNPMLGQLCYRMRYCNNDPVAVAILSAAAEKHPQRDVRGQATYALGEYYRQTARDDWGRQLSQEERNRLLANAEQQFAEVGKNYSDVKSPDGKERLGELAKVSLTRVKNIPNLQVGKAAPEVIGESLDGASVKLSDYRGKVVVMVFWGSWCGPCMAMVPHERELFEKMKDKPFVLLGVNCGDPRDKAKKTAEDKQMNWTLLWDGETTEGPIQSAYNVLHWPTVYVLDEKGTIRYFDVREKELDTAVEKLVADLEMGK